MKKIVLLFFTFSGNCYCFAQAPAAYADTICAKTNLVTNTLPLQTSIAKQKDRVSAKIFPNPARNKVEIEIKGFEAGYVKLQLLNSAGKIVKEEKRLVLTGSEIIIFMFAETAGLYYLLLKQGARATKTRFIIQ